MTPKLMGGPFLIQIYNIEPLLAWAIETTKVNTEETQLRETFAIKHFKVSCLYNIRFILETITF